MLSLDRESKWEKELKYQLEAETSQSLNPVVLLDVDDTLAMSNQYQGQHDGGYHYHQPLIKALKQAGLTEVYLFTAYLLRGISKTLQDEPIGIASRLKLIQYLTAQGFEVKGVLTLLDPIYNQGVGAYYQQFIRPFEEQVLKGESLLEGEGQKHYREVCLQEAHYLEQAHQQAIDKARLFAYTQLQLAYPACLYFDDKLEYLRQVEQTNLPGIPLLTYQVKPQDTIADYQAVLEPFLSYCQRWQSLSAQIINSPKITNAAYALNKFKKSLQEIIPRSEIPLAFHKKLDSIELQWQLLLKNPYILPPSSLSAKDLEKTLRTLTVPQPTGYELWGYGDSPLFISKETALLMLSEDEQGNLKKYNSAGNGYVSRIAEVFFKRAAGLSTLQPLAETFVFELAQILGGGIVAPTRLLLIRRPKGRVELVQASLKVGDLELEQILMIPKGLQGLQGLLGDKLLKALPQLISGGYFQDWLAKQDPQPDLSLAGQKAYFVQALKKIKQWPEDLQTNYQNKLKLYGNETIALEAALGDDALPWLKVWALIESYPELLEEGSLNNLLYLPSLFEALREVYPNISPAVILEQTPSKKGSQ